MRNNLGKKLLAAVLSLAMVLSLVGIQPASANAAAKLSITKNLSMNAGDTKNITVKGLKKSQFVKVSFNKDKVSVKKGSKTVKSGTTKIVSNGKNLVLKVTAKDAAKDYGFKVTVKCYKKGAKKAFKTLTSNNNKVTVSKQEEPGTDEPTPEEPVVEEATLTALEATHVKELTATLSKEVAGLTEKDFTVKKGNVKVTPASVTVEGTKVVIALGTKITEGTYSVTYKESTVEVKTEDEKVVELKTVGTALSQIQWTVAQGHKIDGSEGGTDADMTLAGKSWGAIVPTRGSAGDVAATISYEALNQYGDSMNAEINTISTSFGGVTTWSEPSAKANGVLKVLNIPAAIGTLGTVGKVYIVSKNGVSSTCEVTFSEESKVAKVELVGIYNKKLLKYVDTIPAQITNISDYVLVVKAYDQYGAEATNSVDASRLLDGQTLSQAAVLTNVTVADTDTDGKIDFAADVNMLEIDGKECIALDLTAGAKTTAGTLQLILVGDRFGSVMKETVEVSQVTLLKSFKFDTTTELYENEKNEVAFTAIDENGNEVKDFDTLNLLVGGFTSQKGGNLGFEKQSDGTAKLFATYGDVVNNNDANNLKESTVDSWTVTLNGISSQNIIVETATATVHEDCVIVGIVKYTGATTATRATNYKFTLYKNDFVFEDQYGNHYEGDDAEACSVAINWDLVEDGVSINRGTNDTLTTKYLGNSVVFRHTLAQNKNYKVYVNIYDAWTTPSPRNNTVTASNADVVISLAYADSYAASGFEASWYNRLGGTTLFVTPDSAQSGISKSNFRVYGYVAGKKTLIPSDQWSIVKDTYTLIPASEKNTKVGEAEVTIRVSYKDEADKSAYTDITASYKYSAKNPELLYITNLGDDEYCASWAANASDEFTTRELNDLFVCIDQYGHVYRPSNALSFSIVLGTNSNAYENVTNDLHVVNNGLATAHIEGTVDDAVPGTLDHNAFWFTVTAKESVSGETATQVVKIDKVTTSTAQYGAYVILSDLSGYTDVVASDSVAAIQEYVATQLGTDYVGELNTNITVTDVLVKNEDGFDGWMLSVGLKDGRTVSFTLGCQTPVATVTTSTPVTKPTAGNIVTDDARAAAEVDALAAKANTAFDDLNTTKNVANWNAWKNANAAAKVAYDNLTDVQKALVGTSYTTTLVANRTTADTIGSTYAKAVEFTSTVADVVMTKDGSATDTSAAAPAYKITYLDGTTNTSGATFTYAVDGTPDGISVGADGKVSLNETAHDYDVDCTVTITATVTTNKISGFVDPKYTVKFTA